MALLGIPVAIMVTAAGFALAGGGGRPGPGVGSSAARSVDDPGPVTTSAPPLPGHEVYGFVPYWEMDDSIGAHLRTTDTTTVALFSVTQTSKGAIAVGQNGYRRISGPIGRSIIADAHARGRRVDVTWTSFGRARNDAFFGAERTQDALIAALVRLRADLGVDGIAVDVEEIDAADIPAYGLFIGRLRAALRAVDPTATVTATTGAGPAGAALAVAASTGGADRIFLMGYDYRTVGSAPGGSAPLSRGDGAERSISWSLDLYATAGIPVGKILLGLPLYGLAWPTATSDVGSPQTGNGEIWIPRRNLATLVAPIVSGFDPVEDVAFVAVPAGGGWQAVYYDSPASLRPKLALANDLGLAGAGFWALGYERGLPGYTDLIEAFRSGRSMAGDGNAPSSSPVPSSSSTPSSAISLPSPVPSGSPAISPG